MQARPQSSTAARIFTSSRSLSRSSKPPITPASGTLDPGVDPRAGHRPADLENALPVSEGAGLAHDAGNLLHALGLYCELLQAPGVLRPEHQHYGSELRQLAERSSNMIHRLLNDPTVTQRRPVASVREETVPSTPSATARPCLNPAETLHNQSALLQRLASPWATLSLVTQDPLPGLNFSAEILERITVNLVLNAAEALRNQKTGQSSRHLPQMLCGPVPVQSSSTGTGSSANPRTGAPGASESTGRIRVSLCMVQGCLRLSVEDNGPGMPPAIAAAFLRPAPLPPGTARGLGHRIVHELAEATGGQVSVRVRPGAGTTLSLDWPVRVATAPSTDGPTLRLVPSQSAPLDLVARNAWSRTQQGGPEVC